MGGACIRPLSLYAAIAAADSDGPWSDSRKDAKIAVMLSPLLVEPEVAAFALPDVWPKKATSKTAATIRRKVLLPKDDLEEIRSPIKPGQRTTPFKNFRCGR